MKKHWFAQLSDNIMKGPPIIPKSGVKQGTDRQVLEDGLDTLRALGLSKATAEKKIQDVEARGPYVTVQDLLQAVFKS